MTITKKTWNHISLSALLDTIQCLVVTLDNDGHVMGINSAGGKILQLEEEQITGKDWFVNFIPKPGRAASRAQFKKLLKRGNTGSTRQHESPVLTKTGALRQMSWNSSILMNEAGDITGVLYSGVEVAEHKSAELPDSGTTEMYRMLAETAMATGITEKVLKEQQSEQQRKREEFLSKITGRLLKSPLEQTRQAVEECLREVNSFVHTDRCYLRIISDEGGKFNCTCIGPHEDAEPTAKRCHELSIEFFNWSIEKLKRGEIIECGDINLEIPPEGCNELEHWKTMGYVSILIIPIFREDGLDGWFGFGSGERGNKWDERDTKMLQVIGNYLAIALDRQAAREKEKELQYLLLESEKLAEIGSWEWDLKTNNIIGSPEIFRLFGYEKEFPLNLTFDFALSKIHPQEISRIELKIQQALTAGILDPFETRLIIDDSVKHIKVDGKLIVGDSGELVKIAGFVQNITGLKKRELELKESEARLSMIYNNTSDLMCLLRVVDKNKIIYQSFNEPFLNLLRTLNRTEPPESLIGEEVSVFMRRYLLATEAEKEERMAKYYEAIETKKTVVYEFATKMVGVGELYHETTLAPIVQNGKVTHLLIAVKDISERKVSEKALKENEERLRLAIQTGKIGFYDWDVASNQIIWNDELKGIFELPEEYEDKKMDYWKSILHPEDKAGALEQVESTFKHKKDYRILFPDGRIKYIAPAGGIILNEEGQVARLIGTILDVTGQKEAGLKLREREERYRTLFENASDAILILEKDEFIECNSIALELYGCDNKEQLIGSNPWTFSPPLQPDGMASKEKGMQYILKALNGQPQRFYWLHCKLSDKSQLLHADVSLNAFDAGDKTYVLALVRDITGRMKMIEALRNSEKRYKTLVETSLQSISIFQGNKIVYINPFAVEMTGYTEEEFYAMTIEDFYSLIHPNDLEQVLDKFDMKRKDTRKLECKLRMKSGEYRWFRSLLKHFIYNGHSALLVTTIDITEQKKARSQIIASAMLAEDQERKRLATELHDGLGQMLTAISLHLGAFKNIETLDEKTHTNYYTAMKMIKQAMDENRSISHNLMPKAIADYGYVSAVEHLIDDLQSFSSLALEFYTNLTEERLPEHLERNLYRITQEAVNNIVRHSHAASGVVQLMKYPDLLILTIEDDGQGFDTQAISKTGHLGLQSIKTRSEAIGGVLAIDSQPGNGTCITLQISLADE